MRAITKPAISLLLIAVFLFVPLTQAGCGGEKQLKQVAEAAKDISGGTRDVIAAVGQAHDKQLITLQQKDKLADLLIAIAKGGQKGVDVIAALEAAGATSIPSDKQKLLSTIFSDEVTTPFLQLLTELGKLTDSQSAAIRLALGGLRTTILLLSQKIGRSDVEIRIRRLETQYV